MPAARGRQSIASTPRRFCDQLASFEATTTGFSLP
jgi:hypothetical protein